LYVSEILSLALAGLKLIAMVNWSWWRTMMPSGRECQWGIVALTGVVISLAFGDVRSAE
jgi:hypothetical protein